MFEAMTVWQSETAKVGEKNSKQVFDKMATAAAALGWPEQIVETARVQMQSMAEMQIKTMDYLMDAWEEQLKSPDPTTVTASAMLSKLPSLNFGGTASGPGAAANPFGYWMQFADQWQKAYADGMAFWTKAAGKRD